ncbi:glycosyltransferase family 10 (fucosyltransferase) c-term domain-containing protein [Ditylenchus destructor]|uniref:Fucosyltransferase n=1 Tax=Ditylenchus destructor TaxID=166010 RepID=A0AAD4QY07_9BILA|nr:glycosyltransferase family 10 (fucosyltransferase) c-term domain-containing protein [Ditylenchus destructor]
MKTYQILKSSEPISPATSRSIARLCTIIHSSLSSKLQIIFILILLIATAIFILPHTFPLILDETFKISVINKTFYENTPRLTTYNQFTPLLPKEKPIILAWTTFLTQPLMKMLIGKDDLYTMKMALSPFEEEECPYKCIYTDNRSEENDKKAAMIIFHLWNRDQDFNASDLPPPNPGRLNVFFQTESQRESGPSYQKPWVQNFFNLTMTFTPNSDIFLPYDKFERIGEQKPRLEDVWSEKEITEKVAGKTGLVLQMVSNCNPLSGRQRYVEELAKHVNLTQYGKCNQRKCPTEEDIIFQNHFTGANKDICLNNEIDRHMFYLAFENAICNYYVTEKFWHIKRLIVPIVLTRRVLEGLDIPKDSFIAVEDFSSVKDLANYLLELQKDKQKYLRLATERRRRQKFNIAEWWHREGKCDSGSEVVDKQLKN